LLNGLDAGDRQNIHGPDLNQLAPRKFEFLKNFRFKPAGSTNFTNSPEKIIFVRKHKCASSTAIQLFQNYLRWRGYFNERPIYATLGGCYPARYDPKCRSTPHFKDHPSIFYHHRFNPDYQTTIGAKIYTSIREPLSHFYPHIIIFTTALNLLML